MFFSKKLLPLHIYTASPPRYYTRSFFLCRNTNSLNIDPLAYWVECSPILQETGVQSQVESYQKLKKTALDTSLLNTQHYIVWIKGKWNNLGKNVAAIKKGDFGLPGRLWSAYVIYLHSEFSFSEIGFNAQTEWLCLLKYIPIA